MPRQSASDSVLLLVDLQERLMPVIAGAEAVIDSARLLVGVAGLLDVPVRATEQNAQRLGPTVATLRLPSTAVHAKMHFDACREPGFAAWLPAARRTIVVAGCEAHVCVLQTVLGLRAQGYAVAVVADAVGSRRPADHAAALTRAAAHGVDVVTAEMVVFEWLAHCDHSHFREALALLKGRPL